jgi:hypothetical protein
MILGETAGYGTGEGNIQVMPFVVPESKEVLKKNHNNGIY